MSVTLHTDLGDLKIELFCESVPVTAENFLALCASGAYDGSPFHRIIPDFIIQTGAPADDPKSRKSISALNPIDPVTGDGGFIKDEIRPGLRHSARGIVAMANKTDTTHTNGSQFFICLKPAPSLDGKNTVFGKVIDGLDVLGLLEKVEVDRKGRPADRHQIIRTTIHANPLAR